MVSAILLLVLACPAHKLKYTRVQTINIKGPRGSLTQHTAVALVTARIAMHRKSSSPYPVLQESLQNRVKITIFYA